MVGSVRRYNRSFLAEAEQRVIRWTLPRIPPYVTSLHLTYLGLAGSFLAGCALIGCNWSSFWLPLVIFGVALNWFGDSFDGSLARYRIAERPKFGFLVDHTCDLFSQVVIIICFGLSPFLSLIGAFVVLLCYLLFSAYTYIRAAVQNIHQMAYIGVGATEFRILMIVWALIGSAIGLREPSFVGTGLSKLDMTIMFLGAMAVIGLAIKAITDARAIAAEETEAQERLQRAGADSAHNRIPAYQSADEGG
jgi:phosphatidylglycerophosphate synthase